MQLLDVRPSWTELTTHAIGRPVLELLDASQI